ncbi:MAG: PD-(D/E)XK nuclease family protein [Mariprofundus sp.]
MNLSCIAASAVADRLEQGALLLASSSQLAVDWKRRLVSASESTVCATPNVLSLHAWMGEMVTEQVSMPVILNRMQENWLWERVIRADLRTELLKSSAGIEQSAASLCGLAGHARDAYAIMQEYCIDKDALMFGGEEADALLRWMQGMHRQLEDSALSGRMLAADVGQQLLQCMDDIEKPESILLAGFDVMTPMQQALLSALQGEGIYLAQVQEETRPAVTTLCACDDVQAECNHIAGRVKALLADKPAARIAIVTSDAVKDLSRLKRALNDVLMPESRSDPSCTTQAVTMNGERLSDSPMIAQLLHVLTLAGEFSLSFDDLSPLLFSPWLTGFDDERFERARLDATLRKNNRHRMTFKSLLNFRDVKELPELLSVLKALMAWNTKKRPANDWVKAVHDLLKATGFVQAGSDQEMQRSNHEIRQMNAFRDVLISLVAVDAMGETLSWVKFLSLLRTGCSEVRLTVAARYANVVVLPLAQVSGLRFDHVFVMGLDEEAFPPPARPYPLLPASVQKQHALPMSSGGLVYKASQQLWASLLCAAPCVEISYARQRDEKDILPSSFVADIAIQACAAIEAEPAPLAMENMDEMSEVPLPTGQTVHGGTAIIRNQSACPFRAFATHRLGITALGETSPGIEATSKGSLIHLALEYIWRKLGRRAALESLTEDETKALIDAAIEHAWEKVWVAADSRTRDYEKKRMQRVLLAWLELELQRPDFRVAAIEQEYLMHLPENADRQFTVKIKADRMDIDAMGRKILIDYKTGAKQSTAKWIVNEENERIEEPQLPQYALAANLGADDAVAFARVRSGDMAYEGLCGEDIGIDGIAACDGKRGRPDDWLAVLDDWRTNINALAMEFVEGRCNVTPRDEHACQHCGLEAVCRIEELDFNCERGGDS